jgi:hypothetical protein
MLSRIDGVRLDCWDLLGGAIALIGVESATGLNQDRADKGQVWRWRCMSKVAAGYVRLFATNSVFVDRRAIRARY